MSPTTTPEPAAARRVQTQILRSLLLLIVGACVLLLASFALSQRAKNTVAANVHAGGVDVSRLADKTARARLTTWANDRAARPLDFSLDGAPLHFVPKDAGMQVELKATVAGAFAVGHQGGIFSRFTSFFARLFRPVTVPLSLNFDDAKLQLLMDGWEQSLIKQHPFAGGLTISGTRVAADYAHAGTLIERDRAASQLKAGVLSGQGGALATRTETPLTTRAEVDRLVAQARSMLANEVVLTTPAGGRLELSPAELAPLLRVKTDAAPGKLEIYCSVEATHALLAPRRASLEQAPENARFLIDAEDHIKIEPGHSGQVLDDTAAALAICAVAQAPTKQAELPLAPGVEPALSTDAAQHLGIIGLMGSYTTRHACCQPRVDNIHRMADLLDGTLVKPGETFSVNQTIGPRTVKNGFRSAPSIEDGDMVDSVGGGVSQFATTLFNALFYGGYDIIERQPHSYWFTRYPMGYDATLAFPHPDVIFKNDTNAGALIKCSYTGTTITVKVYGDNGGRRVRAEVSPRQDIVLPPTEYIPNRELDADEEKPRTGGEIGWTVVVKRTITFAGGELKEEKRRVTYKPRARRVEVHPCRIPAGEPGYTGEKCPKPDPDKDSEATDAGAK